MGENGRIFDGEIDLPGGSFSRLLFSADADEPTSVMYSSSPPPRPHPPPLFSASTPRMLCFGDFASQTDKDKRNLFNSSPSHKKRNGSGQEPGQRSGSNGGGATTPNQTERNGKKKNKSEIGPTRSTAAAVHAKTDTASVLHEAMGYIRFLQDQVKVLSSPYLQRLPSSLPPHHPSEKGGEKWTEPTKGLRSRGLCLVPVQGLVDIGNSNGADLWSSGTSATTPSKP